MGDSCGNERGFDQSFATAVQGKYPGVGFLCAKRAVNEKIAGCGKNSSGFTNMLSPQGGAFSGDLLDQKSKSPLFPGPGGLWLQMTSALCVHVFIMLTFRENNIQIKL